MDIWYVILCFVISAVIYNGLAKELNDKGQALLLVIPCFITLVLMPLFWD